MEIFFRAQSKKYFEKMKCAIGFDDVQELKSFIEDSILQYPFINLKKSNISFL